MLTYITFGLSSVFCIFLQVMSRNLMFAIVSVVGLVTWFLAAVGRDCKHKWPFVLAIVLGNGALLVSAVIQHLAIGQIVNDYSIITAILLLFIVLATLETLSKPAKASRE